MGYTMGQPNEYGDLRVVPVPHSRRENLEMARIVNQGIVFQERVGTDFAAAFMSCRDVSVDIALRVLSRPWERRRQ